MKKYSLILLTIIFAFVLLAVPVFAEEITPETEEYTESENFFEEIYEEILKHSDKILSALAFVASLLLALTYKKGLLPLVKGALSSLGNSVSRLKEETENATNTADENMRSAVAELQKAEDLIFSLSEKLETLEGELSEAKKERAENGDMRLIMKAQVDMLYEIFMSSSLPLYQKEAVGEKISEMKKALLKSCGETQND